MPPPDTFGPGIDLIVLLFIAVCGLCWLIILGMALTRGDLDPVTRLMWVMVIIFVPLVGMVLYLFLTPRARKTLPPPSPPLKMSRENDVDFRQDG